MTKFSKEVKIGLAVALSLFIFGWGVNYLKGRDLFVSGYKLYGVYSRIDGLTEASPIYYKGFKIGSVRKISLLGERNDDFLVTMSIDVDIEFPTNSVAQIYSLDLMGSKGIRLLYGDNNVLLESGDTLRTSITGDLADQVSQEVLPLKDKVENMVIRFDSVMADLQFILDKDNEKGLVRNISEISYNFKNISESLDNNLRQNGQIGRSIANLDSFTTMIKYNGKILNEMMHNLKSVSEQLKNTHIDSLASEMNTAIVSVNGILSSLNEGEGTLGKLIVDEELYDNLNDVSVSLDRLLNDVRVQPKRYVNFSAISFGSGKEREPKNNSDTVYKVLLKKSKYPLELRGQQISDNQTIQELRDGKYYLYAIGEEKEYSRILELKNSIVELYPDAEVVVFNGEKYSKK